MGVSNFTLCQVNIAAPSKTFQVYNAQAIQIIDSQLGGPVSANTLTLYNAQITVTNTLANTNLVTLGGLAAPPTNNSLAFFNTSAAIVDMNVLGTGPITLGNSTLAFQQASVNSSNTPVNIVAASTVAVTSGNNTFSGALTGSESLTLALPASTFLTLQGDCSGFARHTCRHQQRHSPFRPGYQYLGRRRLPLRRWHLGTIGNNSMTDIVILLGGLTGGTGSKLQGSSQAGPGVDTYVIGGLDADTTFPARLPTERAAARRTRSPSPRSAPVP